MTGSTGGTVSMYQGTDLVKRASIVESAADVPRRDMVGRMILVSQKERAGVLALGLGELSPFIPQTEWAGFMLHGWTRRTPAWIAAVCTNNTTPDWLLKHVTLFQDSHTVPANEWKGCAEYAVTRQDATNYRFRPPYKAENSPAGIKNATSDPLR